jgi:SAM-dependent methyltransferase
MHNEEYFSGKKLRGDDFSLEEIEKWFEDEKEGYANLGSKNKDNYQYVYHELNKLVSFKYLDNKSLQNVLGIGSAYGDEFLPIIHHIKHITILDPSDNFSIINNIKNVPCEYIKPNLYGDLPFADNSFDLITSFGVFHHIPNVSHVFAEAFRVLKSGGIMCIREPIVSMGDWSKPRRGLTKNERGIPYEIFFTIAENSGFKIVNAILCDFPPLSILASKLGMTTFNNKLLTRLDLVLSQLFKWNINYHPNSFMDKLRPASLALVLEKE